MFRRQTQRQLWEAGVDAESMAVVGFREWFPADQSQLTADNVVVDPARPLLDPEGAVVHVGSLLDSDRAAHAIGYGCVGSQGAVLLL